MQGNAKERWLELCEQAEVEQDREKLLQLTQEINRLLEEKEARLAKLYSAKDASPSKQDLDTIKPPPHKYPVP